MSAVALLRALLWLMVLGFSAASRAEPEAAQPVPAAPQEIVNNAPSAAVPAPVPAPAPLNYLPGKTTQQEAMDYWREQGMQIVSSGYLALGAGQGVDNMADAYMRDAEILDVRTPGIFDIPQVRFVFFKGVLYSVQASLRNTMPNRAFTYSDADLEALRKQLVKKHGKPTEITRTYFGAAKKPDVSIWRLQGNELVFVANKHEASFSYTNPALGKKLEAHKKVVCKEFNVNGRNFCW